MIPYHIQAKAAEREQKYGLAERLWKDAERDTSVPRLKHKYNAAYRRAVKLWVKRMRELNP